MLPPLYHCGYQSIVIIFATIVQLDQPLSTTNADGTHNNQNSSHHSIQQLALLHDIISEFDQVIFKNVCKLLFKINLMSFILTLLAT